MRGLIFNYLLQYIEFHYGYDVVDKIIELSNVTNNGSYTDSGMYEDREFMQLLTIASETLKVPIPQLLESCGKEIFKPLYKKLVTIYDQDLYKHNTINNTFDFIGLLEDIHYKEVVKLYPDSIFPHFNVIKRDHSLLEVVYHSQRHLPFLAKGMLEGCIEYFNEALIVEMKDDSSKKSTHFIIRKEQV